MTNQTLRLRIFAGPNGSGKSTIINSVRHYKKENGVQLDFGIYINADDIAQDLRKKGCSFSVYEVTINETDFVKITLSSGLINTSFNESDFRKSFAITRNKIVSTNDYFIEQLAQIIAHFLRITLLKLRKKFSFETVFSHQGKVDFMKAAKELGYKVYLYFVSTEDPEINVYRVKEVRVKQNGHDVPEGKIRSRYERSMNFLYEASQYAYQSFYFDNSAEGEDFKLFAHFELNKNGEKVWDQINTDNVPLWFYKYYSDKIS